MGLCSSAAGARGAVNSSGPGSKGARAQSIQDEARSFRSKAGGMKILIRKEGSRKAFLDFLKKTGHTGPAEELLNHYLNIEKIKRNVDKKAVRQGFIDVITHYQKRAEEKKDNPEHAAVIIYATLHSWKPLDSLTDEELFKHMVRSQEDVILAITPFFESFMASSDYRDWEKDETSREKRESQGHHSSTAGKY